MGKILKTINFVIGAIRPKQVTWSLNQSGSGYEKTENEMDGNFETHRPDIALESVKTKKETEDVFELYLTDNGIPWMQTKTKSKSGVDFQDIVNPKFTTDEIIHETKTNLADIQSMQESINYKSNIRKKAEKLRCPLKTL